MSNSCASLPVTLRLCIAQYLTAQELQAASSSCKMLYQFFAHQDIWENAYTSLLNGYPKTKFFITHLVRNVQRPDLVRFAKPLTVQWLEDWTTSWKQKTIFILHILKVQGEVVSAVRQKADIFEPPRQYPLYDSSFIAALESHLGALLPIDFVLFLLDFAHKITFQTGRDEHRQRALLASGMTFEERWNWQEAIDEIYFAECDETDVLTIDETGDETSFDRDRLLTTSSRAYLNEMTIACFSLINSMYEGEHKEYVGLILDADQTLEDGMPKAIEETELEVDFESMKNGAGKVVYNAFFRRHTYELKAIAESFTDYLVQWGSVITVIGYIPKIGQAGYADIKSQLPRHPKSLSSILLPQYHNWSVGNYAPIYFSIDRTPESSTTRYSCGETPVHWDSRWPDPPNSMMHGCSKRYWKPYIISIASKGQMLKSLQELEREENPKYSGSPYQPTFQLNIAMYDVQKQMIDDWVDLTPCKSVTKLLDGSNF